MKSITTKGDITKTCIIVLGMHRSGTSALTGVLSMLGIHSSDTLLPAMEGVNPKGFWEHAEIVSIHDKLLAALNSSWDDESPLPYEWWNSSLTMDFRNQIVNVLRRDFSSQPLWLIKDPRMCRLLPLWQSILHELDCQPLYILALRNPSEVAQSLHKRNNLAETTSCLLWLTHMLEAEYQTRNQPRVFVSYERLLSDWRAAVADIRKALGITWPIAIEDAAPNIDAFLDTSLRHHDSNAPLLDQPACRLAQEGYALLSTSPLHPKKLDHIHSQTSVFVEVAAPLSKQLKLSTTAIACLESEKNALESENEALHTQIFRIKHTVSWQITKPLRFFWNKLLRLLPHSH